MLSDFDLTQPKVATCHHRMKSALLKLSAARRELEKAPSYGRAVEVQLAEKDVNILANEKRKEIRVV